MTSPAHTDTDHTCVLRGDDVRRCVSATLAIPAADSTSISRYFCHKPDIGPSLAANRENKAGLGDKRSFLAPGPKCCFYTWLIGCDRVISVFDRPYGSGPEHTAVFAL